MKTYEEVAARVLDRRDTYIAVRTARRQAAKKAIPAAACACLAVLLGMGVWQSLPAATGSDTMQTQESATGASSTIPAAQSDTHIVAAFPTGAASCDASPKPGHTLFFLNVEDARQYYGDSEDTRYLLAIDMFTEDDTLSGEALGNEYQRLTDEGYTFYELTRWEYQGADGQKVTLPVIVGLFTESQLQHFPVSDQYGYAFHFVTNGDGSPLAFDDSNVITSFIPAG